MKTLPAGTPVLRCRACGDERLKILGWVRGARTGEDIPAALCRRCGHYSAFPTAYRDFKSFDWEGVANYIARLPSSRRHSLLTISYLLKQLGGKPERIRFLDVGCGLGAALLSARDLGLDAVGIDPEIKITEYGRAKYGLRIITGKFEEHSFGGEKFDVIYLEQVLEHIESPVRFLEQVRDLTSATGLIYIGVPAVNFLNRAVTRLLIRAPRRRRWSNPLLDIFFDPEEHVNGFTGTSMAGLAARLGMDLTCLDARAFLTPGFPALSSSEKLKYGLRSALGPCGLGQYVLSRR